MQIKATLKPGRNGTKQLLERYGDQLICVRYRYDKIRHKRLTTVELIVDEQDWQTNLLITPDKLVNIRIGFGETELREKAKEHGAFWDREQKTWRLSYRKVIELGLEKRIVDELDF